jgi:DNA modification methylase
VCRLCIEDSLRFTEGEKAQEETIHREMGNVNLDNPNPGAHDTRQDKPRAACRGEPMGSKYRERAPEAPTASEQLTLGFAQDAVELAASDHVHRWYDYVQGFDPELATRKIREHVAAEEGVVFDPFCGSGTTLVAAQFLGHQAIGVDANPLMCLVCEAKTTWDAPIGQLKSRAADLLSMLEQKLAAGPGDGEPACAIPMKSVNKWFLPSVLREVLAVHELLRQLPVTDRRVKNLLRMAYAKAMFESSQVSMCPGITFVKKPRPPLRVTLKRKLSTIASDLELLRGLDLHKRPKARVHLGDARSLGGVVASDSVDLIFTSPPYPTDIEYTRQTRAELYVLDFIETMDDVRAIKKRMVRGSPKNIYKSDNNEQLVANYTMVQDVSAAIHELTKDKNWGWDYARTVREYFGDMLVCLQECLRVLKPGGWALLVVGDQTCKGVRIPATDVLSEIGRDLGFAESYVEQVRERRSTTHSMTLPENTLALRKPG